VQDLGVDEEGAKGVTAVGESADLVSVGSEGSVMVMVAAEMVTDARYVLVTVVRDT